MVNATTGVNFANYATLINKYGDSVLISTLTKSVSNVDASETLTVASTALATAYIVRKNKPWVFDKAGEIEGGDAVMVAKNNLSISKNDLVTWNGNTYRALNVLARDQIGGNVAYYACNLFLI
jgi:hypothetical protein